MHRHIYDVNLGWGQFLDFYSDLNNARKESDEKYVERNYIGEEIPEPEDRPIVNEDLIDSYQDNYGQLDLDLQSDRSVSENFGNGPTIESSNVLTELQDEIREEEKAKVADPGEPEIKESEDGKEEEQRLIVEEQQ